MCGPDLRGYYTLLLVLATPCVACMCSCAGTWKPGCDIRMLYDGQCSLCMKEVNFLRKRDAAAGRIDFVDIADPSYRPEDNAGITFEQVRLGRTCCGRRGRAVAANSGGRAAALLDFFFLSPGT